LGDFQDKNQAIGTPQYGFWPIKEVINGDEEKQEGFWSVTG
jgi:hypothetical protein